MKAKILSELSASLLPCPFCSGKPQLEPMPGVANWWRVRCTNIHCGGTNWAQTDEEASVSAWNSRFRAEKH